jgi:hypothetical protein
MPSWPFPVLAATFSTPSAQERYHKVLAVRATITAWGCDDVILPVFLDPITKGCIDPVDYTTVKSSLLAEFGNNLDSTDTRHQSIYANNMNQRWGFILSYDWYEDYPRSGPFFCCLRRGRIIAPT